MPEKSLPANDVQADVIALVSDSLPLGSPEGARQ